MPTVLLLDVSLSMARNVKLYGHLGGCGNSNQSTVDVQSISNEVVTKKALAVHSIYRLLDSLGHQAKLEYVALVSAAYLRRVLALINLETDKMLY